MAEGHGLLSTIHLLASILCSQELPLSMGKGWTRTKRKVQAGVAHGRREGGRSEVGFTPSRSLSASSLLYHKYHFSRGKRGWFLPSSQRRQMALTAARPPSRVMQVLLEAAGTHSPHNSAFLQHAQAFTEYYSKNKALPRNSLWSFPWDVQ